MARGAEQDRVHGLHRRRCLRPKADRGLQEGAWACKKGVGQDVTCTMATRMETHTKMRNPRSFNFSHTQMYGMRMTRREMCRPAGVPSKQNLHALFSDEWLGSVIACILGQAVLQLPPLSMSLACFLCDFSRIFGIIML